MANPVAIAMPGTSAVATWPPGGSIDPFRTGLFLYLDDVDLIGVRRLQAKSLELTEAVAAMAHLEFVHQAILSQHYLGYGEGGYGELGYDAPRPSVGQRIVFRVGTVNLFLGTVDRVEEEQVGDNAIYFVRVEAVDLNATLARRLVTEVKAYTNQTAGAIVTDLVTTYLANEGITTNSVQAGPMLASFTIDAFTSIAQALRDLSDRTAYIFYIDANGDLHFEAQSTSPSPFNLGREAPDEIPLYTPKVSRFREQYRNRQTIRYTSNLSQSVTRNDTAGQATRASIEGGSGIYHNVADAKEITTSVEATDLADALLRRYGMIPTVVEMATHRSGLRAGQAITLTFPEHGVTGTYLIDQLTVRDEGRDWVRYGLTALSGEHLDDAMAFWRKLKGESK